MDLGMIESITDGYCGIMRKNKELLLEKHPF